MTDRVVIRRWDGSPYQEGVPPLVWTRDDRGEVLLTCANGHLAGLNHEIDAAGNVSPSLLCRTPHGEGTEECGWHVFARLEGYEE